MATTVIFPSEETEAIFFAGFVEEEEEEEVDMDEIP